METPDKIVIKEHKKGEPNIATLYGIDFEYKAGQTIGMMPLQEIADKVGISLISLHKKLRGKSLLNTNNEISERTCPSELYFNRRPPYEEDPDKVRYAKLVLTYMVALKDGVDYPKNEEEAKKILPSDHVDLGLCGHEQFITDLITA